MSPILVASIAGISVALLWGIGDFLSAKSAQKLSPYQVSFGSQTFGVLLGVALLLFADLTMPTTGQLAAIITGSTLINIAYIVYVKALVDGAVGIVVPLSNCYALITVLLSTIFLSVTFNIGQYIGIVIIIAGAVILAYEKNHKKIPLRQLHKDNLLAFYAMLMWGVGFFFIGIVIDELNWQTITFISEVVSTFLVIAFLYWAHRSDFVTAAKDSFKYPPVLWAGFVGIGGIAVLYMGSDYANNITIPTVISTGSSLVAAGLGAIFGHERLGINKRIGAIMVVCGIVLLNLL